MIWWRCEGSREETLVVVRQSASFAPDHFRNFDDRITSDPLRLSPYKEYFYNLQTDALARVTTTMNTHQGGV